MSKPSKHMYEFGPFRLDTTECLLLREEEPVPLTPKAFETLLVLVQNSGHILRKDELMKAVWPDSIVEEANLTLVISMLRKALGERPDEHKYIETVPRRGYRFVASVKEVWEERAELLVEEHTSAQVIVEEETEGEKGKGESKSLPRFLAPSAPLLIAVLLVGLAAALFYVWMWSPSKPTQTVETVRSLAVLPFQPLGAEASDDYLGLGMTDTLITKLSNIRRIIVRPTSAVRKYTSPEQDPLAAGREQGVEAVLEGSIQRSGEKIRVTVRLLNVRDGSPLWAHKYDEQQCTDIFAVQDSISEQVAAALVLKLTGEEMKQLAKRYTGSTEAYQAYLKGRYFWNRRTEESLKKGIEYFNQAIDIDPNYALAYVGLADSYNMLGNWGALPPGEAYPKAKAKVTKALEIDDTIGEAHAALALATHLYDWDWSGAEREFQRAIELDPNYGPAHQWYSVHLSSLGRFDEALAEAKRAQELEPLSLIIDSHVGWVLYLARRYDQAIEHLRKTLELDPYFVAAHIYLARAYLQKGMYKEAIAEFQKANTISVGRAVTGGELGHAYAVAGRRDDAVKALDQLKEQWKRTNIPSNLYYIGLIHTGLGEKDRGLEWLQKAYEERYPWLVHLKVEPRLDPLRSDPRFRDLLRRVGLAP